jgi:hypothetical protein
VTLTAWGLVLDIVGVALIWASSIHWGIRKQGYGTSESALVGFAQKRWGTPTAVAIGTWGRRLGWSLLLVGFALQLVGEVRG